ncbi:uncharacterized protein BCR38DRAFT_475459 [Pseudomassariella vexata]|uniref:Cyanovirin-N domain-containing protein n=1 Tax=Pseudomassariella vexata TaxID=1141098 RepID=A0A1Y2DWR4_9PEZI|nr:uncharacterized protein BCR38DRAFT_475459 [Pseudomassariella vexata]ORY63544.1 hypothetical protein BCR38DRAFT_475459 [Pseudomassariella vexata]
MKLLILPSFLLPLVVCIPSAAKLDTNVSSRGAMMLPAELAQFDFKDQVLTNICANCNRAATADPYNCTIDFDWDDPNYNKSAHCNANWEWDGVSSGHGPDSEGYLVCHVDFHEYWQFGFTQFTNVFGFKWTLGHKCEDTERWKPSTEYPQFFTDCNGTLNPGGRSDNSIVFGHPGPLYFAVNGVAM